MWTVRKKNKDTNKYEEEIPFYGRDQLFKKNKEAKQIRIGFIVENKGIARPPTKIFNEKDQEVGEVTSGTYSPILAKGIGMGFVPKELSELGTKLFVTVRDKKYPIVISKTPFVEQRYYRG